MLLKSQKLAVLNERLEFFKQKMLNPPILQQRLKDLQQRSGSFVPMPRKYGSWVSRQVEESDEPVGECMGWVLVAFSWIIVVLTFPFSLIFCLKVIKEYERAVFFRLGRLMVGGARGPGLVFMLPCVDTFRKVDLRVVSFDVPPQEILSKDSVTVTVDAVIYFRISSPIISVINVNDAFYSTKLLAQTSLRNILGTKTLSEMLTEREHIAEITEKVLDEGTDPWGVKVERVEMKDIRLPEQLMRAMAAEAEATREARAKVIAAKGEQKSSHALSQAAEVITSNPIALQLRYLQTLNSIAAEHNSTIVFPIPVDVMPTPTTATSATENSMARPLPPMNVSGTPTELSPSFLQQRPSVAHSPLTPTFPILPIFRENHQGERQSMVSFDDSEID